MEDRTTRRGHIITKIDEARLREKAHKGVETNTYGEMSLRKEESRSGVPPRGLWHTFGIS